MLQRDHPSPSFGEADPNTLRPPGAGQTVDPETVGQHVPPGRMGENHTTTQEGPQAQGVARLAASEDVPDTTRLARGVRSPHDSVEEPADGGAAVMESNDARQGTDGAASTSDAVQTGHEHGTPYNPGNIVVPTQFIPGPVRADTLLQHRPATLAGGGPEAIIEERVNTIANAGTLEHTRGVGYLAHRLMAGRIVRFASKEERAAVQDAARKIAEQTIQTTIRKRERFDNTKKPTHKFAPLPKPVLQDMVETQVAGFYSGTQLLHNKDNDSKRPLLDNISRLALQNSTYLEDDRVRFLTKVKSLLPKPAAPKQVTSTPASAKQPVPQQKAPKQKMKRA